MLTTLFALTHTTNAISNLTGVRRFLPALAAKRFSVIGALNEDEILHQMDACCSFDDQKWTEYWMSIALRHVQRLDQILLEMKLDTSDVWLSGSNTKCSQDVTAFLSQGANVFSKTPLGCAVDLARLTSDTDGYTCQALDAVNSLMKTVAYLFVAAWPGITANRIDAYWSSTKALDVLLDSIAPVLGLEVSRSTVDSGCEKVMLYGLVPKHVEAENGHKMPAVLVSNGLEGTNAETIMAFLRAGRVASFAWFCMEMPGTYSYNSPMAAGKTETIYNDVISFIQSIPYVDATRIGMLGISFGANWAVRMACANAPLKAIAANGAPLGRSLGFSGSFGKPEIIIKSLSHSVGAKSPLATGRVLRTLAPSQQDIEQIKCPVLAINGSKDTLVSTQDTEDLARWAPNSQLKLYRDDDHCAMASIGEWISLCEEWFTERL